MTIASTANPLQLDTIRVTVSTPFLERARPLLKRGFSIIPLRPAGKEPQPGIGTKSRSRDLAQIEKWASSPRLTSVCVLTATS
jgi:hypothetical protein